MQSNLKTKMLKQLLDWDPFNLGEKKKYKKYVMLLLYIAIASIVLSIVLYLILAIFSDRSAKLSEYSQQVRSWKKKGEDKKISDISVAVKIMPSENTKKNMILLEQQTGNLLQDTKITRAYNYSQVYFLHKNTAMYFPTFHFIREDVPVGDSEVYCVHAFWAPIGNLMLLEIYESIKGFPGCSKAFNERVSWHIHDPKYGVEVNTWKQQMSSLPNCNSREDCQTICDKTNGIAKRTRTKEYVCYSYKVLTDICILVDYNATDSWTYKGGCFEGKSPLRYETATPGETYNFSNVRIQVRSANDPFIVVTKGSSDDTDLSLGSDIDFLYTLAFLLFFASVLCGVVVAAAVILKEYIFTTKMFANFFQEGEVQRLKGAI